MMFRDETGDVNLPRPQSNHKENMITGQPQRSPLGYPN